MIAKTVKMTESESIDTIDVAHPPTGFLESYVRAFGGEPWFEDHDATKVRQSFQHKAREAHAIHAAYMIGKKAIGGAEFYRLRDMPETAAQLTDINAKTYYLSEIWLHPDHQGKRYGAALLGCVEQAAASLGAPQLSLWTHSEFEPLSRFYEQSGYRRSRRVKPIKGGPERTVWIKDLFILLKAAS